MKKRLFAMVMSLLMIVSAASVSAYAAETKDFPVPLEEKGVMTNRNIGVVPSAPYGIQSARPEVIEQWRATNNEAELASALEDEAATLAAATWVEIDDFYYYGQEKSTSCGPASVKMALKGLTGITYSESTIRTGCQWSSSTGATLENCTTYLNSEQSIYDYDDKYSVLKSLFNSNMYNAVSDGAPPIVGIVTTTEDGWFYNTSGHALAIYAILSDKSQYALADPWGGYADNDDWKWYTKTDDDLFDAYDWNKGYIA